MSSKNFAKALLAVFDEDKPSSIQLPASGENIRMLIIANDPKFFDGMTPMLKQKAFEIRFARSITEVVGQNTSFRPHVVLLSWNLTKYNVKAIYKTLSERLNSLVMVYSEDSNPTITMQLNNSGISQTLFPPLSADGIATRIDSLLKKHFQGLSGEAARAGDLGCSFVPASAVDIEIEWQQVDPGKRAPGDGVSIWKGISALENRVFLFEGKRAPKYANEKWETGTDLPVFLEAKDGGEDIYNALGTTTKVKEGTGGEDINTKVKIHKDMHIVEKCLRMALSSLGFKVYDDKPKLPPCTNVCAMVLKSPKYQGYLVGSNSIDCFDPDFVQKIAGNLAQQMNQFEKQISIEGEPMLMMFNAEVYQKIVTDAATFQVVFKHKDFNSSFTFLSGVDLPQISDKTNKNFYGIPALALKPGLQIEFDLYLNLPTNGKFILYRKNGTTLDQATIDKLHASKCQNFYVTKEDLDKAMVYQTKVQLADRANTKKHKSA